MTVRCVPLTAVSRTVGRLDVEPFGCVLGQRHTSGCRALEMLDLDRVVFFRRS